MPSSEIDAIRALLTAKARPVGWAQSGWTRSARSGRWPMTSF